MKAIMIIDLDDSFMVLDEDTITLEKGTIKYRDINRNPFAITIEGLKLKPMPQRKIVGEITMLDTKLLLASGYNLCIDEILGEKE